jgi:hypothetical protein
MALLPAIDNLKQAHELAYFKACENLRCWDPVDMAASSGSSFVGSLSSFRLKYVDEEYKIDFPSGDVTYANKFGTVAISEKIVLLHYLIRASGLEPRNSWISFREIPAGGMVYYAPFTKRVTNYLVEVFGEKPYLLLEAGKMLGGWVMNGRGFGVKINVLPRLPIVFAVWAGDDEFSPRGTVLFDATASSYLSPEDLVVAASFAVKQLAKISKLL